MTAEPRADAAVPLVVDLDDTLIRTDLLLECFWTGMGTMPLRTLAVTLRHLGDRPALKAALAGLQPVGLDRVPVDPDIVSLMEEARAEGRPLVLATGSTAMLAHGIADKLGPFDTVLATEAGTNLTGPKKAALLVELYGPGGFDYVGDNRKDIAIWKAARRAYAARPEARLIERMRAAGLEPLAVGRPWNRLALLRALRPLQWVKNVLLILPLIAAHRIDAAGLFQVLLGFISFSAVASAIYIVNDLTDLDADRRHQTKRLRPFAAGTVPLKVGMAASVGLGLVGLGIAAMLGGWMFLTLLTYLVTTLAYSLRFKRLRWIDIATLGGLYTLRVVAGAAAAGVAASGWLIAFVFPVFLTLACVKRLTELGRAVGDGPLPGRRYVPGDRTDLLNVAILGALASVGVFVAYSFSLTADLLYARIWALWLVALLLGLWLIRMIRTGWSGEQDYDPIVFALTDRVGLALILCSIGLLYFGAS